MLHLVDGSVCKGCNGIQKGPMLLKKKQFHHFLLISCRALLTRFLSTFFFVQVAVKKFPRFSVGNFSLHSFAKTSCKIQPSSSVFSTFSFEHGDMANDGNVKEDKKNSKAVYVQNERDI